MAEGELELIQIAVVPNPGADPRIFGLAKDGSVWQFDWAAPGTKRPSWTRLPMTYEMTIGAPLGGKLA